MISNQHELLKLAPIKNMVGTKQKEHGVSWGLSEAGYDIRIKQDIHFKPNPFFKKQVDCKVNDDVTRRTRFTLASAIEEFDMPDCLVGIVHDKSTWARKGLSVFNTVIEPGFKGGLTLELVYHGNTELIIPAGSGIAQVLFHKISRPARYEGKYQFQSSDPEPAREY
jgi:dCTP deaminase